MYTLIKKNHPVNMKWKILYIIENTSFGGGERAFAQVINGLDKEKYEVYVACGNNELFIEKIKNKTKVFTLNLSNRFNPTIISKLTKIMKTEKIQIIHSQGARADFFARISAKLSKVPLVISTIAMPVEGFNVNWMKKTIYIALDRFTEKFVHKFIVVSEVLRERLIKIHKIAPEKIIVIPNGVEIEEYNPDRIDSFKIRNELNLDNNTCIIGTIGRLVWQKGLEYFIESAKFVLEVFSNAKFLIVGEGELKNKLENLTKQLKLNNNILFLGFRKDISEILGNLDIFVLPSIREGMPIITLEAMAMAKPIVASNIEGVREQIINDKTGVLVPAKNPKALAEAIISLIKDKEKAKNIGNNAREIVKEKFIVEKMVKEHEKLYQM